MKKIIILLFFTIILTSIMAQTPNWVWADNFENTIVGKSHTIVLDHSNHVLIAGNFASTNLVFGNNNLVSQGSYDVYVAKYDTSGNSIWAIALGGALEEEAWDLITDASDNVYVTGYFKSPDFHIGSDTVLHNTGESSMFLAKFDSDGSFIWARASSGNNKAWGRALGVDEANDIYLGGNFIYGDITIADTDLVNQGNYDMFILKYDSDGNVIWIDHTGGEGMELLRNLEVSPEYGNIYIIGDFSSNTITFGTNTFTNLSSSRDNFVVKYNNNGEVLWANHISGTGYEQGSFITVDWKENIYVTGQFESEICNFGSFQLTNSSSTKEIYIASYDFDGSIKWVKGITGNNDEMAYSITSDKKDGIYLCGWSNSTELIVEDESFDNQGMNDFFVTKYNFNGEYFWTKYGGSDNDEFAECIVSDTIGNLYVTGNFSSSNLSFDNINLSQNNNEDVFVAKLASTWEPVSDNYVIVETNSVKFYPNPTSNYVYFNKKTEITLYALDGVIIKKASSKTLNIERLDPGLYILNIEGKNYKLIKE